MTMMTQMTVLPLSEKYCHYRHLRHWKVVIQMYTIAQMSFSKIILPGIDHKKGAALIFPCTAAETNLLFPLTPYR